MGANIMVFLTREKKSVNTLNFFEKKVYGRNVLNYD